MANRAVCCLRLLSIGRNIRESHSLALLGRSPGLQGHYNKVSAVDLFQSVRNSWGCVSRLAYYSSSSGGNGGGEENEDAGNGSEGESLEKENDEALEEGKKDDDHHTTSNNHKGSHQQNALAPVSIPDVFPVVPVLPISRNPIFPKFVKILEVRRGQLGHTFSTTDVLMFRSACCCSV